MRKGFFVCIFLSVAFVSLLFSSCIPSSPPQEKIANDMSEAKTPPTLETKPVPSKNIENSSALAPANESSPPTSTSGGGTTPPTKEKEKPKRSKATLRFGTAESGIPFSIQQTPLVGEEGFAVKGSFGLSGTLTRPDKNKDLWVFAGQFEFPSEEYKVGKIDYVILNAPLEYYTQQKPLDPSFIPNVMITIPMKLPKGVKDEKGDVKVPFRLEIPVSAKAQFMFTMIDEP